MIHLVEYASLGEARVGQPEAVTTAVMLLWPSPCLVAINRLEVVMHEMGEVRLGRCLETHPGCHLGLELIQANRGEGPASHHVKQGGGKGMIIASQRLCKLRGSHLMSHQAATQTSHHCH